MTLLFDKQTIGVFGEWVFMDNRFRLPPIATTNLGQATAPIQRNPSLSRVGLVVRLRQMVSSRVNGEQMPQSEGLRESSFFTSGVVHLTRIDNVLKTIPDLIENATYYVCDNAAKV